MSKQLHLGAFMRPVGIHTAWWRDPGSFPDANSDVQHLIRFIQTLERGKFDAFFMADHLAVLNMPTAALRRSATVASLDPLTLLPALAMATQQIGPSPRPRPLITSRTISPGSSPRSTISAAAGPGGTSSPPAIRTKP